MVWRLLYLKAKCNKEEVSLSYECKKSVCIFKRIYVNLLYSKDQQMLIQYFICLYYNHRIYVNACKYIVFYISLLNQFLIVWQLSVRFLM